MKDPKTVEANMDAMIARYGWAVQGVGAGPDGPTFTYTVGLAAKGLPEIIVFGLPMKIAHQFLNQLGHRFTTTGVPPLDTDLDDVAEGFSARLIAVPRAASDRYMFATRRRYPDYTAVQLIWPDTHGLFPWEPGFDPALVSYQPVLHGTLH
jgi:hypothetical protein